MQRITLRHILISKTYTMQWEISNSCARYSAKNHNDSLTHSDKCGKINVNFTKNSLFQLEKWKIYSHGKNISSNQLFSKDVIFTKFLQKMFESKFPPSPQHQCALILFWQKWKKAEMEIGQLTKNAKNNIVILYM